MGTCGSLHAIGCVPGAIIAVKGPSMTDVTGDRHAHPLLTDVTGHAACLLGNEAIVRGALEAGVAFACGYPGTPSSEVTDAFARLADSAGIRFEYSVNEKIALETAFGASLAGARAICAMKHLGLMYAGDPLSTMPYVGTVGGLVVVSAGDPSCRTSPNEQDQRYLGPMLHVPILDPGTPQECLDLTRYAFDLSEESNLPVILRPMTRVCHTRATVAFGPLREPHVGGFERDAARFNPIPFNARRMRVEIEDRLEVARNSVPPRPPDRKSVVAGKSVDPGGRRAMKNKNGLREEGVDDRVALLSLAVAHPLPEDALVAAMAGIERLLVLEELSPFLEDAVTALCARRGVSVEVLGKRSGHTPRQFEYEPPVIRAALHGAFGLGTPPAPEPQAPVVPPRPPILCPGCPHRSTFYAARAALVDDDQLYFNDIGCYTLGYGPPLETSDALLCMGAGITLAAGVARVTGRRTVGLVGDSTFFHSGMPALLDAIKEKVKMVVVVLDNEVTAMTGFQESPTVHLEEGRLPVRDTSIEDVVRALGAPYVERIDPNDVTSAIGAFRRAHEADGVGVIISERACPVYLARAAGDPTEQLVYEIDHERCRVCGREGLGTRCGQCATEPFSRQMARCRSQEVTATEGERPPVPDVAPCATLCPLNLCIQGYAAHIATGHYAEALELIMERLPLPDSVCRVCDRPCEDVCVRAPLDGAVAINDLKRFVMDWAAAHPEAPYAPAREAAHGRAVAIVGAGPSGLAAAHDLALRGYGVTLYDEADAPGGLLRHGIPSYRLPLDALERDVARILELGVVFEGRTRLGRDVRLAELLSNGADAVYLAVGAQASRTLDLPPPPTGAPVVIDALEFLRGAGDGVARGQGVVVVGGGNAAIDAARSAVRHGAGSVALVCLETRDEMPAITDEIDHAAHEGVEVLSRRAVARVVEGGVEVVAIELEGDVFDVGRVRRVAGTEAVLEASCLVMAIGQVPDRSFLAPGDPDLASGAGGGLSVDAETLQTSDPRVFAGGDAAWGAGSVTGSIAAGLRAAWGIDRALRGADSADRRAPPPRVPAAPPPGRPGVARREPVGRHVPPQLEIGDRTTGFDEVIGALDEVSARAEAHRCMICGLCGNCRACVDTFGCPAFVMRDGLVEIEAGLCNGCGVCVDLCPNGAIVGRPA